MVAPASTPLVSVVIPAHRAAAYLAAALDSVAAQTWPHWEVLVFEDGAYDDTPALVAAFAARTTNRVEFVRSPANVGVSRARNALLDLARGTHIAFLDADDTWEPDHLTHALELLTATPADWFIGGANHIDRQGRCLRRDLIPTPLPAAEIPTALLGHNFVLTGAVVVRAEPFARGLRFDPSLTIGEDLDLWLGLVAAGCRPVFSPRATFNYRKHPVSTTADPVRFPEAFAAVFEKHRANPLVEQRVCRRLLRRMLLDVARMTWRREPHRARAALHRLFRTGRFAPCAWILWLLARPRANRAA